MSAFDAKSRNAFYEVLSLEVDCYERALSLVTPLADDCASGAVPDERLQPVYAQLDKIEEYEATITEERRCWDQAGRPVEKALQALLDRIGSLIRQIQAKLDVVQRAAEKRRDELIAELDVCNRRYLMRRAYQRKM